MPRGGRLTDTASVAAHERLAFWRDVVRSAFVPADVRPLAGDGPLRATARGCRFGPVGVTRITADAQLVERRAEHIAMRAGTVLFLNLLLAGVHTGRQDGPEATMRPGDFLLLDSTRPFQQRFEGPFDQLTLVLPLDLVLPRLAHPASATGVPMPTESGLGAMIAAQAAAIARHGASLDRQAARAVAGQLVELLALAFGRHAGRAPAPQRVLLRQASLDAVERRLPDPALAPAEIAAHLSISVRYLHALFADMGTTFGGWVRERRLENAHRELAAPGWDGVAISVISARWGFRDPSHFARAFRRRYGISPRAYRARSRD